MVPPAKAPKQRRARKGGRGGAAAAARGGRAATTGDDGDGDGDADEDNEVEVIRCVCGARSQEEDSDVAWIACDMCGVWQHNVCMGISPYDEDIPDKYSCEQCNPDGHTELLEAMARGEQLWEERQQKREAERAERKKRRGGRRGPRKRVSDSTALDAVAATEAESRPATPDMTEIKGPIGKRKAKEQEQDKEEKDVRVGIVYSLFIIHRLCCFRPRPTVLTLRHRK